MTAEQIKEKISEEEYECYGIRSSYRRSYNVGDICRNSHQWWQDDPGEEAGLEYNENMGCWDGGELNGTCALWVTEDDDIEEIEEILEQSKMYGDHPILIAGDDFEGGNDIGEVIIKNAKVLAMIEY